MFFYLIQLIKLEKHLGVTLSKVSYRGKLYQEKYSFRGKFTEVKKKNCNLIKKKNCNQLILILAQFKFFKN